MAAAVSDFDQAIRMKPDDALAYFQRGSSRLRQGKNAEAESDFEKSLAVGRNIRAYLEARISALKHDLSANH
jgi:tetratricopeptide (TPR) repeat protein